jgi:hypothetical protein
LGDYLSTLKGKIYFVSYRNFTNHKRIEGFKKEVSFQEKKEK